MTIPRPRRIILNNVTIHVSLDLRQIESIYHRLSQALEQTPHYELKLEQAARNHHEWTTLEIIEPEDPSS